MKPSNSYDSGSYETDSYEMPLFLWIPVTPVTPADGCDDWSDENDGGRMTSRLLSPVWKDLRRW